MRAMFDALLAAAVPVQASADLYAIILGGDLGVRRAAQLFSPANVVNARVGASAPPVDGVTAVAQPADRGTLPALMLALLELLPRDPEALVIVASSVIAPADALEAVGEVVADPEQIARVGSAETFATGLVVVAEARLLLGRLFEASPAWAAALCDGIYDAKTLQRAYDTLPAEAVEGLLLSDRVVVEPAGVDASAVAWT